MLTLGCSEHVGNASGGGEKGTVPSKDIKIIFEDTVADGTEYDERADDGDEDGNRAIHQQ